MSGSGTGGEETPDISAAVRYLKAVHDLLDWAPPSLLPPTPRIRLHSRVRALPDSGDSGAREAQEVDRGGS